MSITGTIWAFTLIIMVRDGNGPAAKFCEVLGYEPQETSVYSKCLIHLSETADKSATGPLLNNSRSQAGLLVFAMRCLRILLRRPNMRRAGPVTIL